MTDVDHAGRELELLEELAQAKRGQRCELGGLQHDGTSGRECRGDLVDGHQERRVPRRDGADDAYGLAQRVGEGARLRRGKRGLARELGGPSGVVAQALDRHGDIDVARGAHGIATIEALEERELIGLALDQIGEPRDELAALGMGEARPASGLKGLARRPHRAVHIGLVCGSDLGEGLARRGIEHRQGLTGLRRHPLAVDEQPVRPREESGAKRIETGKERGGGVHEELLAVRVERLGAKLRRALYARRAAAAT